MCPTFRKAMWSCWKPDWRAKLSWLLPWTAPWPPAERRVRPVLRNLAVGPPGSKSHRECPIRRTLSILPCWEKKICEKNLEFFSVSGSFGQIRIELFLLSPDPDPDRQIRSRIHEKMHTTVRKIKTKLYIIFSTLNTILLERKNPDPSGSGSEILFFVCLQQQWIETEVNYVCCGFS